MIISCDPAESGDDVMDPDTDDGSGNITEGVFTDSRDGQQYAVVLRDGLWWMMDNFSYEYTGNSGTSRYWTGALCDCNGDNVFDEKAYYSYYDNRSYPKSSEEIDAGKTGRVYTLEAAEKAAPAGWRLPTREEVNDFRSNDRETYDMFIAGILNWYGRDIKPGPAVAEQLEGLNYGCCSGAWTSSPRPDSYPNGDDRDWYYMIGASRGRAHYDASTVRYVISASSFTP